MKKTNWINSLLILSLIALGCTKVGPEGKKSLIDFVIEPKGVNCSTGGYKVVSGIDMNNNNILEVNEIENTKYICNGTDGLTSLINIIPELAGNKCSTGGYKIITGIDINNNKVLEESEIQNTEYVCNGNNGINGYNSLINIVNEPKGNNCLSGGYKIISGLDSNKNNLLDNNEIQNTQYVCNGNDGINSLFSIAPEGPGNNCTAGGYKINYGKDVNSNGILDNNEIVDFIFICNGVNGSGDIETRISIEWTANTISSIGVSGIGIYGFNKDNFVGVDSIVFVGAPYSGNTLNNSIIDLYDFTSNQVIPGSEIKSNKDFNSTINLFTKNLFNKIPSGSRDLGIRLRSEIQGEFSGIKGNCYLYLYRK